MSILKRLVWGNLVVLLLVTVWGGAVAYKLDSLRKITREIVEVNGTSLIIGERLLDSFTSLVKLFQKYYVSGDIDYYNRVAEFKILMNKDFKLLGILTQSDAQTAQLSQTKKLYTAVIEEFETNAEQIRQHGSQTGLENENPKLIQMADHLKKIIRQNKQDINTNTDVSNQLSQQIFLMTVIITAITVFLGCLIALFNTRAITASIARFKKKTKEISQGHFEELETMKGPLEIRDLSHHFNTMARRLSELDDLKGDFISHVSHELKTPITAIKEASVMLSQDLFSDHPKKRYELYALIEEECDRLLYSVLRLLDYSKMEAREMEYDVDDCDLLLVVRKSILKLAPLAQKKQIDMEFLPPPRLPVIQADENRIREIMDNLIGNALKFTPDLGRISIKCALDKKEKKVVVSVADNGCGIQHEYLDAIFQKFKQIDQGVSTRMGTGLGLSISKHIIKAHGGEIWAENNSPQGARFFFTLPLA